MVEVSLARAKDLQQELLDFILDAEGDLAVALEAFSAQQLASFSKSQYQGASQNEMALNMFLTDGRVGDKTPIDLFEETHPELPSQERELVKSWQQSFVGLFAVNQLLDDGFEVTNWLTDQVYVVKAIDSELKQLARAKEGEILLTRISPVGEYWMFSGPVTVMGKLGKPKLSVAIGNFKQNYKSHLYGDAPSLLAEAWLSVEEYYHGFVEFFGADEITLPGYKLQKQLTEFQRMLSDRRLANSGIDSSKSLKEIAREAGVTDEEIAENIAAMGVEGQAAAKVLESNKSMKMVMPDVELPKHLKDAPEVTVLAHKRWGQIYLTDYCQVKNELAASSQPTPEAEKILRKYLASEDINVYVFHQLAKQYPAQLELVLQTIVNRPDFNLQSDLDDLLKEFHKPLNPELPEIASVPVHLHNLFQEALAEVSKNQSKGKGKSKAKLGFQ